MTEKEYDQDHQISKRVEMAEVSYIISTMEKEQARSEVLSRVVDIIFTSLNLKHIDRKTVHEATPLTEGGLNLDSIDILELIIHFEQQFHIKLNESEAYAQHFKTVGSIVDFVHSKQAHS